jgi:hypothetical protein
MYPAAVSSVMVFVIVEGSTANAEAISFVLTVPARPKIYLRYSTFRGERARPHSGSIPGILIYSAIRFGITPKTGG